MRVLTKLARADFSTFAARACPFQIVAKFITAFFMLLLITDVFTLADRLQIR
jgi:hypothetical protein